MNKILIIIVYRCKTCGEGFQLVSSMYISDAVLTTVIA